MKRLIVVLVMALSIASPIQAGLIGQEITAQWVYPSMSNVLETHDLIVGSAVELPPEIIQNDNDISIDIGDDYILFTSSHDGYWGDYRANGWRFVDKNGTIEEIVGYTIGTTTGAVTGLDFEDLVFTADSVFGNFGLSGPNNDNVIWDTGSTIRLDIAFVPEPATMSLLALGGMAVLRRRSRKARTLAPTAQA